MDLKAFLTDRKMSITDFARLIGVSNPGVVAKYVNRTRVPRPAIMREIARVTDGAVQPNDFIAPPADEMPTDQARAA